MLGRDELDAILHDRLGYRDIVVPQRAFAEDATWGEVVELVERLEPFAMARGRGLGVKFSNTLVVENNKGFFPASEPVMYLSGPPLHPLAIALVARFRRVFGDRLPVSFSGGIDEGNFADTIGLGLKPVTVCSDFLKFGGYRRGWRYFGELVKRMDARRGEGHRYVRAESPRPGRGRARRLSASRMIAPPRAAPRFCRAAIRAQRPETPSRPGSRRRGS